jgi:hypothetical protein
MRWIRIILITILIAIFVFLLIASKKVSESQDTINLPNRLFNDIRYYNDELSDSNGKRAFPWGIETWADTKGEGYELPDSYFDKGQVQLTGHGTGYISVLAIPDVADKPLVIAGFSYTQSFEIKLDNVQGKGVRVIHQFFDSTNPDPSKHKIIRTDYGKFETGTSGWHTVYLTRTAPPGALKGDIIIELWGTGTVYIRNPRYHMTTILDVIHQIRGHDVFLYFIVICVVMMLFFGFRSLISLVISKGGKT